MAKVKKKKRSGNGLLFIVFLLIGLAFIVAYKFQPEFQENYLNAIGFPIGVLAFYAITVALFMRKRTSMEQAGDNCYYMGFLFTLTSLGMTMLELYTDGGIEELESMEKILFNFGIAVFSTIFGIFLRVLFHQARSEPEQSIPAETDVKIDNESSEYILGGLQNVCKEITEATSELKALKEDNSKFFDSMNGTIEMLSKSLANNSNIGEELKPIVSELTSLSNKISEQYNELIQSNNRQEKILESASTSIQSQNSSIDKLVKLLEDSEKSNPEKNLEKINDNLSKIDNRLSKLKVNIKIISLKKLKNILEIFRK